MMKLWNDEAGFIVSAELVLIATILVLGMIVGLVSVRDQVVQELGDIALAFGLSTRAIRSAVSPVTRRARRAASCWTQTDYCDDTADGQGTPAACISVTIPAPPGGKSEDLVQGFGWQLCPTSRVLHRAGRAFFCLRSKSVLAKLQRNTLVIPFS